MAYTVTRRASEIGVRLALGAERGQVVWMVLREALWLDAAGNALGIPATLAATSLIESRLFGVKATDPATLLGGAVALLAVAAASAWMPARRASGQDPVSALRSE
jgi:ABC-type antimicrobial peptide transport system permease subunit